MAHGPCVDFQTTRPSHDPRRIFCSSITKRLVMTRWVPTLIVRMPGLNRGGDGLAIHRGDAHLRIDGDDLAATYQPAIYEVSRLARPAGAIDIDRPVVGRLKRRGLRRR